MSAQKMLMSKRLVYMQGYLPFFVSINHVRKVIRAMHESHSLVLSSFANIVLIAVLLLKPVPMLCR
jgi:hypothetical protein